MIFTNLTPGVEYTYTIRVVLADDRATDVVPPTNRSFVITDVQHTLAQCCSIGCIAGVVTAIFFLVVTVFGAAAIFCTLKRHPKRKMNQVSRYVLSFSRSRCCIDT